MRDIVELNTPQAETPTSITVGDITMNFKERTLVRDGKPIQVRPMLFAITGILLRNHETPMDMIRIYEMITHTSVDRSNEGAVAKVRNTMKVNFHNLRKALGEPNVIRSISSQGYQLIATDTAPLRVTKYGKEVWTINTPKKKALAASKADLA